MRTHRLFDICWKAEGDMTSVTRRVDNLEKSFVQATDHIELASKHLAEAIILFGYNRYGEHF